MPKRRTRIWIANRSNRCCEIGWEERYLLASCLFHQNWCQEEQGAIMKKLGSWCSADQMIQLVLDRQAEKWLSEICKMRLQISSEILPRLMGSLSWISWELKVSAAPNRIKEEGMSKSGSLMMCEEACSENPLLLLQIDLWVCLDNWRCS